jgi:PadR family transcriptional regulator, regulatory protein AphA
LNSPGLTRPFYYVIINIVYHYLIEEVLKMDVKYALLGFLSWRSFTGYELKKTLADSLIFYWSGNNNQIYTALVELHKDGLATNEIQHQERYPSRKVYSITEEGRKELRRWLSSAPEPPQFRKTFLIQLAWADSLPVNELDQLLSRYQHELEMLTLMLKEQDRRGQVLQPARTPREQFIWKSIAENYLISYTAELDWVRNLRQKLRQY